MIVDVGLLLFHSSIVIRQSHRKMSMFLQMFLHTEYRILSLTHKVLTTAQPTYLHHFITVQPHRSTRSSSVVTLPFRLHHHLYE